MPLYMNSKYQYATLMQVLFHGVGERLRWPCKTREISKPFVIVGISRCGLKVYGRRVERGCHQTKGNARPSQAGLDLRTLAPVFQAMTKSICLGQA